MPQPAQWRLPDAANDFFDGSSPTHVVHFYFDPDGKETVVGSTNSSGKSVELYLYRNGRITSQGNASGQVCMSGPCPYTPSASADPPWFNWN